MPQPLAYNREDFKLFLEGIDVPFTKFNIAETEGNFPSATVAIPATRDCLRVLPGTVVQIVGPQEQSSNKPLGSKESVQSVLLFEGEVVSIAYSKEATGRALQLQCSHVLNRMAMARSYSQDSLAPQMHKNARMIFTNASAPVGFPGVTNKQKQDNTDSSEDVVGVAKDVKEFTLANRFGGVNFTAVQAIESILPGGDLNAIVQRIIAQFDLTDYYWCILDTSYRIRSTIITFPNKSQEALSAVVVDSMKKLIASLKEGPTAADVYTLLDVLNTILDQLRYQLITPSAPTGGVSILGSGNTESFEPLRSFGVPDLDAAPPALCNTFFPEQIINFSYSRSYFAEPTRTISYLDWNASTAGSTGQWGINFVIPDLQVYQVNWVPKNEEGEDMETTLLDYSAAFTAEEAYQGARPIFNPIDGWMTAAANEYYKQSDRNTESITDEEAGGPNWSKAMKNEAMMDYMDQKYGKSRSVTLQTAWNPSRMCGLPGLIIDPGFPTMYGVVSSIQTQVLADGSCSSSVVMRAVRAIYDEDPVALQTEDTSLYPNATRTTDSDIFPLVHDFLYQADLYGYTEIGRGVYTYMTQGLKPSGKSTALEDSVAEDKWNVNKTQFDAMPQANHYDYSIFRKIRNQDNLDALSLPQDADNPNDSPEQLYAKYLYHAVKVLKAEYLAMLSGEAVGLKDYLTDICYRQLCPFNDYLNFIQASNIRLETDYKELVSILSTNASTNIQVLIDNAARLVGKISDTLVTDKVIKELKLDFGTGSNAYSLSWYKEEISKIKLTLEELENNHATSVQEALDQIENNANVAGANVAGVITHTIKSGETLSAIAASYDTTIAKILEMNPHPGNAILDVEGNQIAAGQSIRVPGKANPQLTNSVIEQKTKARAALDNIYNTTVARLNATLNLYEENITLLQKGVQPPELFGADDVKAVYRPYDATRRDHVLIAFNDLLTSGTDMTITK
tara:strand:+ start:2770 stop:5652 length:2883 start_codon:yes stop_codon:yes gene_type:complete